MASTQTIAATGYSALLKQVRETLVLGQQRIEQEKVQTYWRTGQLIREHVLKQGQRAEYGKEVVLRLAKDLEVSETVLRRCVRFAEQFPIQAGRPKSSQKMLSWSHYRALITVQDEKKRFQLADRAARLDWGSEKLEEEVKKITASSGTSSDGQEIPQLTVPHVGPLYTYRLLQPDTIHSEADTLFVDLGFAVYVEAERFESRGLQAGDIVTSTKDSDGVYTLKKASALGEADLFTYKALVERVIDGDTLKVQIDLGFNMWTRQVLRLRAIDSPEMDTEEGKAAKVFVQRELKNEPFITIKSTRSDKYDRYLSDVFYKDGAYLNQRLLDEAHAVTVAW